MARSVARSRRARRASDWNRRAVEAARLGDHETAVMFFTRALEGAPREPSPRFNLGLSLERLGEIEKAAAAYSAALALAPDNVNAARRLSALLANYRIECPEALDARGLKAALAFETIDREPVAETALRHLAATTELGVLRAAARRVYAGRSGPGADGALPSPSIATRLFGKSAHALLSNDLFVRALETGINRDPALEVLLTAGRR